MPLTRHKSRGFSPRRRLCLGSFGARNGKRLPPCKCLKAQALLSHARAEDKKLRKELTLEVLALKVPFGSLLSVSESSPVAGAIKGLNPSKTLDAGRARELQKCAQPATQMLSVHCLYQRIGKSARGNRFFRTKVYRDGSGLEFPNEVC